tara:strand:+ start:4521 stop:5366 length:846 start_codon:yes stop_codon:yes gene_type:complete
MGFSFTGADEFDSGDVFNADKLKTTVEKIRDELNGHFGPNSFPKTWLDGIATIVPVIDTHHIFKPEFYGSPSPHVLGISSDTYYRRRSGNKLDRYYRHEGTGSKVLDVLDLDELIKDNSAWQPIEGLSATVFIEEGRDVNCHVMCNFYAFESGGKAGSSRRVILREGRHSPIGNKLESLSGWRRSTVAGFTVAAFCLFLDKMDGDGPQRLSETTRYLYGTGGGRYRMRRMNHSINKSILGLTAGENKISVRCVYRQRSIDDKTMRHLYIDQRNLVVDLMYR